MSFDIEMRMGWDIKNIKWLAWIESGYKRKKYFQKKYKRFFRIMLEEFVE